MYCKAYNYCKSTWEGVTEKDIVIEYPHIVVKINSICPYFWHLREFVKDKPCTNSLYVSNSLDTYEGGISSIFRKKCN